MKTKRQIAEDAADKINPTLAYEIDMLSGSTNPEIRASIPTLIGQRDRITAIIEAALTEYDNRPIK